MRRSLEGHRASVARLNQPTLKLFELGQRDYCVPRCAIVGIISLRTASLACPIRTNTCRTTVDPRPDTRAPRYYRSRALIFFGALQDAPLENTW